jgi:translation initiation factor 2B subunit (eIF-2B alpha/beta/delta family)
MIDENIVRELVAAAREPIKNWPEQERLMRAVDAAEAALKATSKESLQVGNAHDLACKLVQHILADTDGECCATAKNLARDFNRAARRDNGGK